MLVWAHHCIPNQALVAECLFALVLSCYEEWEHPHCSLRSTKHFSFLLSKAQRRTGRRGNEQPARSNINSSALQLRRHAQAGLSPPKNWQVEWKHLVEEWPRGGWDTFCIIVCSQGLALLWQMLICHTHRGAAREQPLWWNTWMGGRGMQCSSCFAWFRIKCSQHWEHLSQEGAVPYHQFHPAGNPSTPSLTAGAPITPSLPSGSCNLKVKWKKKRKKKR